jgi:hypothetical protein
VREQPLLHEPGTKVEIDYALTDATVNSQWRLVGADGSGCNAYSAVYPAAAA